MGILDKVRNLFTEEVEEVEEKPVAKRETRSVETVIPKRETPSFREEAITSIPKVEEPKEKVVFPVYFDDKDFDDLEKPKPKEIKKEEIKREELKPLKSEPYKGAKVNVPPEPKKIFTPSPIISPVYGILDKNYRKDDIVTKTETARHTSIYKKEHLTIDDIRNKAYGTLEDEIDDTLLGQLNVETIKETVDNSDALDMFNELDFEEMEQKKTDNFKELEKKVLLDSNDFDDDTEELARQLEEQKKKLAEINQYMSENEVISDKEEHSNIEDDVKEDTLENDLLDEEFIEESLADEKIEEDIEKDVLDEVSKENDTNLNDSELFDLIDSMYEKRDEE